MTRLTRQQVIDVNCRDSDSDDQDTGTLPVQIERCLSPQCPFIEYRPLTTATMKLQQEAKVETMPPEARAKYKAKQEGARMRLSTGKKQQENEIPEAE